MKITQDLLKGDTFETNRIYGDTRIFSEYIRSISETK